MCQKYRLDCHSLLNIILVDLSSNPHLSSIVKVRVVNVRFPDIREGQGSERSILARARTKLALLQPGGCMMYLQSMAQPIVCPQHNPMLPGCSPIGAAVAEWRQAGVGSLGEEDVPLSKGLLTSAPTK